MIEQKIALDMYTEEISTPIKIIEAKFFQICFDERPNGIRYWPGNNSDYVQRLYGVLKGYENDYSPKYHSSKDMLKMKRLQDTRGSRSLCMVII